MSEFVRNIIDEDVQETHDKYTEFERKQFIINLDIGEKVEINVYDKEGKKVNSKEFIAKFINCHINCQWQDKGAKNKEGYGL